MQPNRLHTATPGVDPRFPHHAPVLGAQALLHEPERTLERALIDGPVAMGQDMRADPWPEVGVGAMTAALSGAITGGVAAGSWTGAGIGAAVTVGGWSGWTLLSGWRALGPRAKSVLGVTLAGAALAGLAGVHRRRRGAR